MGERRYVKCVRCGHTIDTRDDYGWAWVKNDSYYICADCYRRYINGGKTSSKKYRKPSARFYKVSGIISKIAGIIFFAFGLLFLLVVPVGGIVFAALGIIFFIWGNAYIKKANGKKRYRRKNNTETRNKE